MRMTRTTILYATLIHLSMIGFFARADDPLYDAFVAPPAQARPFFRWWWNGDCVTKQEIERELDLMQAAGAGGIEINPIAMPEDSTKTAARGLPWLSAEWNQMLKTAVDAAHQRGLQADLIVGSGWPFGGRFLRPDETIQGIGLKKTALVGPYRATLRDAFNPATVEPLMCRHQISIDWQGNLYDCDFNLALRMPVGHGAPSTIREFDASVHGRRVVTGNHCYGCTAGCGSSCGGALV